MSREILIFHPDIHSHKTNNEYTKKIYSVLQEKYDVKSLEWFVKHPFANNVRALYLNWFENTIGKENVLVQRLQYFAKLIILRWAKFRKIKICYAVHNKTPHSIAKDSLIYLHASKGFIKKALRIADSIVELCGHTENYLRKEFDIAFLSEKIAIVPHGKYTKFDVEVSSYREKYNISNDELVFAFVGKIDKYKNIDIILKSFYLADIKGKLLLVGKIDEEYRSIVQKLIVDERVITDFAFVSDEDMSGIMQAVDAIILPYENTSINSGIMINAFSNGTTVIGTAIEMLQDYDDNLVYGYQYSDVKEHVTSLAKAMKRAEQDGRECLLQKGRTLEEIIIRNNNWESVKKSLINAIEKQ